MKIVNLLIEYTSHSLDRPFLYAYNLDKPIDKGYRVIVPFNKKQLVGYVLNVEETSKDLSLIEEEYGYHVHEIIDVLDTAPLLNADLMQLTDRIQEYYLASKINVLQTMLPASLSPRSSTLKAPKIAYDKYIYINDYNEENLTHKQIEVMRFIASEGRVLKSEIKEKSIIKKLLEQGYLKEVKVEKRRLKLPEYEIEQPKELTKEQLNVINEFNSSNDSIYLLQGVTGSGKTEVYLSLSEKMISEKKNVLMLVPEISLTPMIMQYFIRRFGDKVAILHSELTPAEKYDEYRKIASGSINVVIGARSAIFAPLENIGLIILDEEHVETYKQDVPPFYHAREVAIMRSEMHNAKVLLGSATPSLESMARAKKGLYHLLKLPHRINNQPLPKTTVINMTDFSNIDRDSVIFSRQLRAGIEETLNRNEQAILLLNRRGFSTNVSCRNCGYVFKCPNCGIALTYHKKDNMLKCHYCEHVEICPPVCPECGSKYLSKIGFGTERVEDEVKRLFPRARTLRLDSDSAKVRTRVGKIIESFSNHEADILIGTQMIAKGHDFPLVTLVGVVLADIGLNMPNFRSSERTFQLITQAVGRSGRSDKIGEAYIQAYLPNHYAITLASAQDYEGFYKIEMLNRKNTYFPPYCYIVNISVTGKNFDTVKKAAIGIAEYLKNKKENGVVVLGPNEPFISYSNGRHILSIIVKYRSKEEIIFSLKEIINVHSRQSNVNIFLNVDPYNF